MTLKCFFPYLITIFESLEPFLSSYGFNDEISTNLLIKRMFFGLIKNGVSSVSVRGSFSDEVIITVLFDAMIGVIVGFL